MSYLHNTGLTETVIDTHQAELRKLARSEFNSRRDSLKQPRQPVSTHFIKAFMVIAQILVTLLARR